MVRRAKGPPAASSPKQAAAPSKPAEADQKESCATLGTSSSNSASACSDTNAVSGTSVGLVSNGLLSDKEVAQFWVSPEALTEEERLAELRRKKDETSLEPPVQAAMEGNKYQLLETLLEQSELFTQFLAENMKAMEAQPDAVKEAAATDKVPSKQKATNKRGRNNAAGGDEPSSKKPKKASNPTQELLPLMQVELRGYQLDGVKWLISLYSNGVNGILADEMGLGKTVQTIGFLSYLRSKRVTGPFMVIGPLSTLSNWVSEFERFAPDMPVILYHGSKPQRHELQKTALKVEWQDNGLIREDYPVIVTSYEVVLADCKFFQKIQFKYLVVDEGHRLKNFNCKLLRELRQIPTGNKLLLTGTPLQNNLSELWSLMNFLMPDIFSSLGDFESWFDFSSLMDATEGSKDMVAAEQRSRTVSKLHTILRPFVLRRLKSDVLVSLPRKQEIILYALMSAEQKKINQQLLDGTLVQEAMAAVRDGGGSSYSISKLNNVLMQLRKNCNHPDLITSALSNDINYPPPDVLVQQCGKMQLLDRLLKQLHQAGHKVLIFSQMTKMLDILESFLDQQGHQPCRIDGSIPWQERKQSIQDFNSDPNTWVFLLSTRAGGLGINLTAADTVIIYDSDWNPHQDMQAMDRCHRIGQQKPVLVFRLATACSVEDKMLKRAASKLALERLVIKRGAFKELKEDTTSISMSAAELLDLIKSEPASRGQAQSGVVSDAMLSTLLDRRYLEGSSTKLPFPYQGVGYEMVEAHADSSLLKKID